MVKYIMLTIIFLVLFAFRGNEKGGVHQACIPRLDGKVYTYNLDKQKPNWVFSILFYCEGDSLRGAIVGPYVRKAARLYFFRSKINNLKVYDDSISFNFIPGELYTTPFTIRNYDNYSIARYVAFSQDRLFYKGIIRGDSIIDIKCMNKYYACDVDSIVFRKTK
jgi:hypothetical protein